MSKLSWQNKLIYLVVFLGLALRVFSAFAPAQLYDIATFEAWSRSFWLHSPLSFFNSVWSDYTPLPILTFAPISLLADLFHAPFGLTFKFVHIALELILIYFIAKSKPHWSLASCVLLLLSPALIGDTAFWGQVDTIPALLTALAFTSLGSSPILLGLAVAYKPIMVLVAPILWIKSLKSGWSWWRLPLLSMLIFFATAIPTGGLHFVSHLFGRIFAQAGTYPYLTVNAFNLWSLSPVLTWIPDATSIFGLSAHSLGFILFGVLSLITLCRWRKTGFDPRYSYRVAATILIIFYTSTTRMHERHLLFGLPLLSLAAVAEPYLLAPLSLLTATFTLNLYGAYYWVYHAQTWPFSLSTISLISCLTVLTALSLALVWDYPAFISTIRAKLSTHKTLFVILLLASLLRVVGLGHPAEYIFDEVYHSFTAREYLHNHIEAWEWWTTPPPGVAYEWTHPPVAKYFMVGGMLLFGENSFGWRIGSAVFGVISILGLYLLVLAISNNKNTALIAAFLVSIEGLHISQSRIGMNDIYMLNFFIWSLYAAVKSRWKLASVLFGLALASKWSALYGLLPLSAIYLHEYPVKNWRLGSSIYHLFFAIRCILIALGVYILTFTPFILAGHTWAQWWELHRQMWYYHTHLVATHAYQSTPLEWIFDIRPVWYYVKYLGDSLQNIYALGNPAILWLGLVALLLQLKKIFRYPTSLYFLLYLIFTLPWVYSPRIMFFYHYLPSATFLCVILAAVLVSLPKKYLAFVLLLASIVLLLISPMLYGFSLTRQYWNILFTLMPSWK